MNRLETFLQSQVEAQELDISELLDALVGDAVDAAASDLHIEPWDGRALVRIRINGILYVHAELDLGLLERLSGRAKILGEMRRFNPSAPQEGRSGWEAGEEVQLRISVFPSILGDKIVIRLFDTRERSFDLGALGFDDAPLVKLKDSLKASDGVVLFTGPTGSGKTTAMYASMSYLADKFGEAISMSSVEDPVEFNLPMVCQAQVDNQREFTYPIALRSLLRQDPQVILVGEIRDPDTAAIAINAGLTGHLVVSTIHSPGTAAVFVRLIHMGVEPFLVASSLRAVVGLRLANHNCPYCSEPYEPESRFVELLGPEFLETAQLRRGKGCEYCGQTGFSGRRALQEIITVDEPIQTAILRKATAGEIETIAREVGFQSLWESGLQRVASGELAIEELTRVVSPGRPKQTPG